MSQRYPDQPVRRVDWSGLLGRWGDPALVVITLASLLGGALAWFLGSVTVADVCWIAGTAVAVVPALWWVLAALRRGRLGVDLVAALALVGTLAVGEYLAGSLVAVMLATGRALEAAAERRAAGDLRALLEHVPRTARRRVGEQVVEVPLEQVQVDDVLLVGSGEVVPVNGWLLSTTAVLDESALTGEPLAVERSHGQPVRSGVVNAGPALELAASATAENSAYATIVRMAREAEARSAPVVRLADRCAAWFLPLSLLVAGAAWVGSGSATRAVAVLVVATPCPLLLAAPVAIVSGLSRASRLGVVIRSGGALEDLGHARTLVLDKTGTLTTGRPTGTDVVAAPGCDPTEVLRLAASVEQPSPHVVAQALVAEARRRELTLSLPSEVTEEHGRGVSGVVDGHRVLAGQLSLPPDAPGWTAAVLTRARLDAAAVAWVSVDGAVAGAILLVDPVRRDAPRTLRRLRAAGIERIIMLTGDRPEPAEEVGAALGLDEVRAEQRPEDKVTAVRAERERAVTVMVGDGVNDAPALAAATVGVAMGARGSTASSEVADVVLTTDHLDRVADAIELARRARRIAVQSAVVGMGLSLVAMVVAAVGYLPPAVGAFLQEGIDLSVILNALRVLRDPKGGTGALPPATERLVHRFSAEHDELRGAVLRIRGAAEQIGAGGRRGEALTALRSVDDLLTERVLPHERAEDTELYPALDELLGSDEATATMSRTHAEIVRLARRLHTHRLTADTAGEVLPSQVEDLLACLYGLFAVLQLHFVTEEESYFTLAPDPRE